MPVLAAKRFGFVFAVAMSACAAPARSPGGPSPSPATPSRTPTPPTSGARDATVASSASKPPSAAAVNAVTPAGCGLREAAALESTSGDNKRSRGTLEPAVVPKVVRARFGAFRACYEAGLRVSPSLSGRTVIAFIIGRDGRVTCAEDRESTLPDAAMVACLVNEVRRLEFPPPDGGVVTVVYPLAFSPGDDTK